MTSFGIFVVGRRALRRGAGAHGGAGRRHLQLRRDAPCGWWGGARAATFALGDTRVGRDPVGQRRPPAHRLPAARPPGRGAVQARRERDRRRPGATSRKDDRKDERADAGARDGRRASAGRRRAGRSDRPGARAAAAEAGAGGAAWLSARRRGRHAGGLLRELAARGLRRRRRGGAARRAAGAGHACPGPTAASGSSQARRQAAAGDARTPVGPRGPDAGRPDARPVDPAERRRLPGGVRAAIPTCPSCCPPAGARSTCCSSTRATSSCCARSTAGCWSS